MNQDGPDFSALRFLIVDDSAYIRGIVSNILRRCNAGLILHAAEGTDAIGVLANQRDPIDCVLCDWNMEPMDGLTLLSLIRSGAVEPVERDLRFIMLTGHAELPLVQAAVASDVSGFLVKPVSMKKMVTTIRSVMATDKVLRAPEHYASSPKIRLPDSLTANARRSSPGVLLSSMRRRTEAAARLPHVRRTKCALAALEPGSVLAEDFADALGRVLVCAGTALTTALLTKLRDAAETRGAAKECWIIDATPSGDR